MPDRGYGPVTVRPSGATPPALRPARPAWVRSLAAHAALPPEGGGIVGGMCSARSTRGGSVSAVYIRK
jgi:hypothetical protein